MALRYNRLQALTGHDMTKPFTEAELMQQRRSPKPEVRALSHMALKLRGELARRKAAGGTK